MKDIARKIWNYLIGKIHITLTPASPSRKVKRFAIRRIYPILIVFVIVLAICSLTFLYQHYESNYLAADEELQELKGVRAENKSLKKELVVLSKDTEDLRQALNNLQQYSYEIRNMIDVSSKEKSSPDNNDNMDIELRTLFSYNNNIFRQGIPMGGGEFRLHYQDSQELIENMQKNLNKIEREIPSQRQELSQLENNVKEHNKRLAATPSIWPLSDRGEGYISSNFGWRNDPHSSQREYHEGLDIAIWYNTPVLATARGKVTFAGWSNGYGWTIKIEHGFGFKTYYAHLNRIKVKRGQEVKRGEVIGLTGNSGKSTGPHLHYEVRVNNVPKNPRKYIGR